MAARRYRRTIQSMRLKSKILNSIATNDWMPVRLRPSILRLCGIQIGRADVYNNIRFKPGNVSIGNQVLINDNVHFDPGSARIIVEDRVALAAGVRLLAATHEIGGPQQRAGAVASADIVIGRGSWIGAGATILSGVTVASGCIIASGAVVNRSTERDGLYGGVPAVRIKDL